MHVRERGERGKPRQPRQQKEAGQPTARYFTGRGRERRGDRRERERTRVKEDKEQEDSGDRVRIAKPVWLGQIRTNQRQINTTFAMERR